MLHKGRHMRKKDGTNHDFSIRLIVLCTSLVLLIVGIIGGTMAWLTDRDEADNQFGVGQVSCKVIQDDNSSLSNVKVQNTSDDKAYIRVRIVGYSEDKNENIISGTGMPADLTVQTNGWLKIGEYYYCTTAIGKDDSTPVLIESYSLQDGQVVKVLAEAIQGKPVEAVEEAWTDVQVDNNGTLVNANNQ